ncbi:MULTISPECIES: O-antigen ligase [Vibrio]|uniref:Ligase n=1 Tax=Vibrio tasmaniensis TaxID=212663 RepID=A0A2N7NKX1_9VIBR|nr:O-antigen ligase family protein [Vibrio tasmaniensis]PMP15679.1 ligase [Vibrio tasmaniensis]TKG31399.1 O-antigen ligase family protein [Vibrio tasmaniensis]TKG38375.1 O-antigen ligase family protein [Vibrio tasmaniensis]TKG46938.1 O-antigen ligase family protein [Vibrio tasmaniensis]TKG47971.1 O-antigen ligase family protein [Vibrio tasmaniensis]
MVRINTNLIQKILITLPLFWIVTVQVWLGQGSKPLAGITLLIAACCALLYRKNKEKHDWFEDGWVWILLLLSIFSTISYELHGFSSQELRATLIALVFFLFYRNGFVKLSGIQNLCFTSVVSTTVLVAYYIFFLSGDRGSLPSNALVIASIQGFSVILLLALGCVSYEGKRLKTMAILAFIGFLSMFLVGSRGPLLAVISIALVVLFKMMIQHRQHKTLFAVSVIVIFSVFLMSKYEVVSKRIDYSLHEYHEISQGNMDTSIGLRLQMYQAGFDFFVDSPLLGIGGDKEAQLDKLSFTPTNSGKRFIVNAHLHNNYIDKAASSGLVGIALLMLSLMYPLFNSSYKLSPIVLLPVVYFSLMCLFDSPFRNGDLAVMYFVFIGVLLKLQVRKEA